MKIQIFSDIHCEHMADLGRSFVDGLDPTGVDVLVLAGDICTVQDGLLNVLTWFCAKFKRVVFCAGNHEYYGSDRGKVNGVLSKAQQRNANLHLFNRDVLVLEGKRFLGATMWFPPTKASFLLAPAWSDFSSIQGLAKWVYEANRMDVAYLRREVQEGDIVITHYLPSWLSVHPRFAMEPSNCFFVCPVEDLITERKPALWVHGHTHCSMDYKLGDTRVVCNPFGYADKHALNPQFREELIIEI